MTVFYVLLYRLWLHVYGERERATLSAAVYALAAIRIVLCLLPQNGWLQNESSVLWGTLRNIPLVALGVIVICLYFKNRKQVRTLRFVWLWITLSYLFYIPVAVAASLVPMLGMLMLPKTVCYMILFAVFWKYANETAD